MQEVGIIEPPIVFPQKGHKDVYMMLDGHMRLDIAKSLKFESLFCLIATDDEAFIYNHKVNPLQPIQEHFMILRAIKSGVSEERIAKTLNVNVDSNGQTTPTGNVENAVLKANGRIRTVNPWFTKPELYR